MLITDIYNPNISPILDTISVKEALEILIDKHFNGVVVLDKNDKLVGIFSLQDLAAAIVPEDFTENAVLAEALYKPNFFHDCCQEIKNKKVSDIMRKDFIIATPQTPVMEIAADFLKNDLYIVPVCENGKVIGIVTRSEIKKALALGMGVSSKK